MTMIHSYLFVAQSDAQMSDGSAAAAQDAAVDSLFQTLVADALAQKNARSNGQEPQASQDEDPLDLNTMILQMLLTGAAGASQSDSDAESNTSQGIDLPGPDGATEISHAAGSPAEGAGQTDRQPENDAPGKLPAGGADGDAAAAMLQAAGAQSGSAGAAASTGYAVSADEAQTVSTMPAGQENHAAVPAGTGAQTLATALESGAVQATAAAAGMAEGRFVNQSAGGKSKDSDQNRTDGLSPAPAVSETVKTEAAMKAETPETCRQISREILQTLAKQGPMQFSMQLEPADLGKIDIYMKMEAGKLVIDIAAASAKTQALLTDQVGKLIASLGLNQVQVESVQISQPQQAQAGQAASQQMLFMDFAHREQQDDASDRQSSAGSGTPDTAAGTEKIAAASERFEARDYAQRLSYRV